MTDIETTTSPITDALIQRVMAEYPSVTKSGQAAYYEAVHQELAPLCRKFEAEIADLKSQMRAAWLDRRAALQASQSPQDQAAVKE